MKRTRSAAGSEEKREKLEELEQRLGHSFKRSELLAQALTHRSAVYDVAGSKPDAAQADPSKDNEQLEFLGDAALGLLVAEGLCRRFPGLREGDLTRLRARLVSRKHLGEVGMRLEVGRWLKMGPTTDQAGGRVNAGLVSNAMEALIAALYLDGGLEAARRFVESAILADIEESKGGGPALAQDSQDYKTAFQELAQAEGLGRPQYGVLSESGPDHQRVFRVEVRLDRMGSLAEADGSTKKQAQQEAARLAVAKLRERQAPTGSEQSA